MNSLTSTAQAVVPGRRQGRSRACAAYQRRTTSSSGTTSAFISPIVARRGFTAAAKVRPSIGAMEGNPLLNPVGSLPPQVYWRRRAMAGVLAVLVVWFVWSAFPGKGGGANAAPPKKPKTTTSAPASTPSAPPPVTTSVRPVVTKAD